MATKPTVANARWATDETNNTAPSSGQRDTGWTAGQVAVSDYFNVLSLEAYKWFQYLSDGDLTGAHSMSDHLTMASGKNVIFSGSGGIVHGDYTKHIPAALAQQSAAGSWGFNTSGGYWAPTGGGAELVIPISQFFDVNHDLIKSVTVYLRDTSGAGNDVDCSLYAMDLTDGSFDIVNLSGADTVSSAASGAYQSVTLTLAVAGSYGNNGPVSLLLAGGTSYGTTRYIGCTVTYNRQ